MTRHHGHKPNPKPSIARSERFKTILSELAQASGLPKNDLRLVQCAWVSLAQENLQSAILAGRVVEVGELERYSAALKDIMPVKSSELVVRYVDADLSEGERSELRELRAEKAARKSAVTPADTSTIAPVDIAPGSPAVEPVVTPEANVIPLKAKPEPKPERLPYAVAVDSDGKPRTDRIKGNSVAEAVANFNVPNTVRRGPEGWENF